MRSGARVVAMMLPALLAGGLARGQTPAAKSTPAPARAPAASPAVATVGPLRVEAAELDQQVTEALRTYRARTQTSLDPQLEPLLRRQALENLIRQRLLALDSRRRGITVTDAEAEDQLRRDPTFQQDGVFNEAKYLALKATNPDAFTRALSSIKDVIASRRMGELTERETRPDEAGIREEMSRLLTRATIEFLALRRKDFDGGIEEPREDEIRAHYAAHPDQYRKGEQATISMILVNRPELRDSIGATAAGYRAWERRIAARADSALAAIRGGARMSDLAAVHGGIRTGIVFDRAKPPDFWRGGPGHVAALFATAPGSILTQPVPIRGGLALIRVDAVTPAHVAPLREVAGQVRAELRAAARGRRDERDLRSIYDGVRDSLRGTAYRVRYAVAETSSFATGEPTHRDLERYYRAHLADYSSYDKAAGAIVERPLSAVRDEVRSRWIRDRGRELASQAAERLHDAWSRGRRDAALERGMTRLREVGLIPAGAPIDTGVVGEKLAQALASRGDATGVGLVTIPGIYVVYDVREVIPDYIPTFEQAQPLLLDRLAQWHAREEEAAAQAAFERDPGPHLLASRVVFTRVMVEAPPPLTVELTREEVERFYRVNVGTYSVPELVRARHILISPAGDGPEADPAARQKAEGLLQRLRAGEDFARLAEEHSDDPATREVGGDLGTFRRGQMREAFERAAFAMRPGDLAGPVRTEVGYHLIECLEYLPAQVHPLREVYANVAYDCAIKKSQRLAGERADSIYRRVKSPAEARAVARRLGLEVIPADFAMGGYSVFEPSLRPFAKKLETMRPGRLYPGTVWYPSYGQAIAWVDTILPPRMPSWDEARPAALATFRREAANRALLAKKAELDSMLAAGWSYDSLATLLGGLERAIEAPAGGELRELGGRALLDSLVFGGAAPPVLAPGQISEWIQFPGGYTKMRILERLAPDPEELERRVTLRRQVILWRNLNTYFDRLKSRYPVQILDGDLRATTLPEPTES